MIQVSRSSTRLTVAVVAVAMLAVLFGGAGVAAGSTADVGTLEATDTSGIENESTARDGDSGAVTTASTAGEGDIEVTYTLERTPGDLDRVRVNYTATLPENVVKLEAYLDSTLDDSYRVVSTDGMEEDTSLGAWVAEKESGTEATVGLTYTVESNQSGRLGRNAAETTEWAFVGIDQFRVGHRWTYVGSAPGFVDHHEVEGEGYASEGYGFAGPVETYERQADDRTFTLVVAGAADAATGPDPALAALGNASGELRIGGQDPTVTSFVVPSPIRRGGQATTGGSTFWIHESTGLSVESPLYHEYVHTRQEWGTSTYQAGDDVEWLTEASADYYGGYLAWQNGTTDADSFRTYVATDRYADEVLQDADGDSQEDKNYFKGRRVLAALDIRLRSHTDGNRTLADVVRHVNTLSGDEFGYADLRSEVVEITNESTGDWLDTYVQTDAAPTIPTDIESAYSAGGDADASLTLSLSPENVTAGESTAVTATVTDAETGAAVEGATVEIAALGLSGTTDAAGEATLTVDTGTSGDYSVSASADGYANATATLTVTPDTGTGDNLTASRTIQSPTVAPGGSTEVTVTAQVGTTTDDLRFNETFDPALAVSVVDDDGATLSQARDGQVVASWGGVSEVTITYNVTVPENATAGTTFDLSGTVEDRDAGTQVTVGGDTTIEVGDSASGNPLAPYANDEGVVEASGLLDAAADFRNGEIGASLLLDAAAAFRSGEPIG